jgi:nicotinamidase-related amidase
MTFPTWIARTGSIVCIAVAATLGVASAEQRTVPTTLRALYGLAPPASLRAAKTALVLVDFQREYVSGRLPLPAVRAAIARASELAAWARREGVLVVLVQQVAARAGSPVFAAGSEGAGFVPELEPAPHDLVIQKSLGGAFSKTGLDAELRARGIDTLVLGGLMTHLAVHTTANDAMVLGYRTLVAGDATATRALPGARGEIGVDAALLKRAALDAMADRAADVLLVRDVLSLPVNR